MNKEEILRSIESCTGMYTLEPHQHAALHDLLVDDPALGPGGIILELGVAFGRTSILLAALAEKHQMEYHGIDIFILCKEQEFRKAMDATGLPYTLHVGFTTGQLWDALPDVKEVPWNKPISLLFVDACHQDPWFSADCRKYLPLVEPGGLVVFDDWETDPAGPHIDVATQGEKYTADWETVAWLDERIMIKRKAHTAG